MKKQFTIETKKGILSPKLIDEFSEYTARVLERKKISSKDALRFRISIETAMGVWLEKIGEGAECSFETKEQFGKISIAISCIGKKCNPQKESFEEFGMLENSSLLQSIGLSVGYSYEDGVNKIRFFPNSGFGKRLLIMLIAFALGIGLPLILKAINPDAAQSIAEQFVNPIFSMLMGVLKAVAGPLVFLSVLTGILSIGDVSSFGTIGKKLVGRFALKTCIALGLSVALAFLFIDITFGGSSVGTSNVSNVLSIVLQFIPTDVISPFLNGNILQIVTIAIAVGFVMIVLGDIVSGLSKVIDQIYSVVQMMMEYIGKIIPLFIFISMVSLFLSNEEVEMQYVIKPLIIMVIVFVIMNLIVYPVILKLKYRVGYFTLMKKLLPTFLVAFSTASSTAAFSTNIETCENQLGISPKLSRFGVPFGQVVFMPMTAVEFLFAAICLAKAWNMEVSIAWIITAALVSGILSFATPPIPGGGVMAITALLLQLGIPELALPMAIAIEMITDYIDTAGNVMSLQQEMIICADKTGLLDKEMLLSKYN